METVDKKETNNKETEDKVSNLLNKIFDIIPLNLNEETKKLFIQIFKFLIVGVIATVIDFILLYIFKEVFHMETVLANTLSFTISLIYNYIASTKWVFDVNKDNNKLRNTILFVVFSLFGLGINNAIIWFFERYIKIHYMIAKVFATAVTMIFNFITRKIFLEKNKQSKEHNNE